MAHDDLWAGIELKLDHARFHFERMDRALGPAEPLPQNPVLMALTGAFDAFTWQREFYAHLDAFLSATRSVPEIIVCCFGRDQHRKMRAWFNNLSAGEKTDALSSTRNSNRTMTALPTCP
jgi:hypothetical protein